ncbi:glycoside hydrolase family 43 protein [Pseudoduganella armeniaca]|uniref:Alpha-N-arabinofuranosidase n=1 Tax=Pseudoduganella armeniaca TaxID=2072590 RepID=A0A2R4CCW9_9BURK|nr:glycoside hydrolase family 43 protein [Pseudoduganella armeniaca]AVR97487.1 alpha-N-arabinofuranosidase [Pseudoduganella armeniaca]
MTTSLTTGAVLAPLALLCADAGAFSPHEPLVRQRADPHVTLHTDGWYYFTATVPEYDRIELRRAKVLDELGAAPAKAVWRRHASGPMSANIWAPELHRINGKWYLYFTAGRADAPLDVRLYVLENAATNPLEGTWTERGRIDTGWESFSLDATTFELRGQRYLAWTQRPPTAEQHVTGIYIAKMRSPLALDGPATLLTLPEYAWEKVKFDVNEAPAVLVRNGKVFLTYSASATDANYSLGMLTAGEGANLLDKAAWTKSPVPVLASGGGQYGPGHNSFTTTPDGKQDIIVYHARDYRDIPGNELNDPNRHTRARSIRWKVNGMPDFSAPPTD